jgi:hypothetical protein
MFNTVHTHRVLRWRLFLEDFGVKLQYIKGEHNHLADALSRLPRKDSTESMNDLTSSTDPALEMNWLAT